MLSDEDPQLFKYDVFIENWTPRGLVLQVNFTDPLAVSHGGLLDQMNIKVINPSLFISKTSSATVAEVPALLADSFPRQARAGVDVEALDQEARGVAQTCQALVFVTILALLYLGTSPFELWTGYYVLQLACFVQVYDVYLPASAQAYLDHFSSLVEFDAFNIRTYIRWFAPGFTFIESWFGSSRTGTALHRADELYSAFNDWQFYLFSPFMVVLILIVLYVV